MIAFDVPWMLYAAPGVALVVAALAWWARSVRLTRAARWSPAMRAEAEATGRRGTILLGIAAFFAAAALAGPRFGGRVVTTDAKALNLVIAVDVSRSMLAEDVEPSRLGRAQQEALRLIQDLSGDRIGLIAFAGGSWILSPLTVDAGALRLLVDGLHPDMASAGGTAFAPALRQGFELLMATGGVADRVLVVFSDGEALDSVPAVLGAVRAFDQEGVRLVMVAEGGTEPTRIPVRDAEGTLTDYQRDENGTVVLTSRRDDILATIADAAGGAPVVSGELVDQAGAVRDLVMGYKRAPLATTTARQDISRAWIPALLAVSLLLFQTLTRRTAALAALAFLLIGPAPARGQGTPNPADDAWRAGEFRQAATLYLQQARAGDGGDTTWLNLGTAALAVQDSALARQALARAGQSIEPELRFRALYNLGLLALRLARSDSANREAHLDAARESYRQALLLRPGDRDAKWNYELAIRQQTPPPSGGDDQNQQRPQGGASQEPDDTPRRGLTREQAEQILNSMLEEERRTREALNRRRTRSRQPPGRKDW